MGPLRARDPGRRGGGVHPGAAGSSAPVAVSTPGVDWKDGDIDDSQEEELEGDQARQYRAIAARLNYMSFDRPDCQYSIKETCREMAKPTRKAFDRLVRIGKYLRMHPRLVWHLRLQE